MLGCLAGDNQSLYYNYWLSPIMWCWLLVIVSQNEMSKRTASSWCRCEWFLVVADHRWCESETSQCHCNCQH